LETTESVFPGTDSVEHSNTFLAVEGARFPPIFGFVFERRMAPVELPPKISNDESQDAKRLAETTTEM
jgi:hypothetical protein